MEVPGIPPFEYGALHESAPTRQALVLAIRIFVPTSQGLVVDMKAAELAGEVAVDSYKASEPSALPSSRFGLLTITSDVVAESRSRDVLMRRFVVRPEQCPV